MSSGQVSQEEVERTKQQIRGLVSEISELAKSELGPDEFYAAFLDRIVAALAAVGGAVWTLGEGRKPQVAYQINVAESLLDRESEEAVRHTRLMEMLVQTNEPRLIPPNSGDESAGNPTGRLLVVAPLGHDNQVEGLIEIFQRPEAAPATQRGYLRFLAQMCEVAAEWFKNRKVKHLSDRHSLWAQADEFTRAVHETLDQRETCYTVVNEGRRLLGVDRVSLALMKGTKCIVEAISGQDTLENRSNVVVNLGKLSTKVCATGEALWYHGSTEDLPPQIEEVMHDYVDESHTRSMAILPLRRPRPRDQGPANQNTQEGTAPLGEILGALIIEQIESDIPMEVLKPRMELVFEHSQRALANVIDYNSLFLMPVWRTLGNIAWVVKARTLPKTLAITAAVLFALFLLWAVPWNFDMNSKGELQPVMRRDVFAQEEGLVKELFKKTGDTVTEGEVICVLENPKLSAELSRIDGELKQSIESLSSVTRMLSTPNKQPNEADKLNLLRQKGELEIKVASLTEQLEFINEQIDNLQVKSPISGRVITWDVDRQLRLRPIQLGQVLMTVANDSQGWELELFMKQSRIGHVNAYRDELKKSGKEMEVDYLVMTDTGTRHTGQVKEIDSTSFQHETEGHVVKVRVGLDHPEKLKNPLPGTTVTAKVHCGHTSIGWYWLHEAWEYAESNLFFF